MKELKNGRSSLIMCDGTKLREEITKRGFEHRDVAALLNYDRGYFNKVFRTNRIGIKCMHLLEERFGILPASYGVAGNTGLHKPQKKASTSANSVKDLIISKRDKKTEEKSTIQLVMKAEIDPDQLKDLIKHAVLEAFEEL